MKKTIFGMLALLIALLILASAVVSCTDNKPVVTSESGTEESSSTPSGDGSPSGADDQPTEPDVPSGSSSEETPDQPTEPVDPSSESTPDTPSIPHDPVFDLKPTGHTVVKKTASDLKTGTLVLASPDHPYDWTLAKGLKIIRAERTSKINVSEFEHKITNEAFLALDSMESALDAVEELKEDGKMTLIVYGGWRDEKKQKEFNEKYNNVTDFVTDPLVGCEHYTGLCVDLKFWDGAKYYPVGSIAAASESQWLLTEAAKYGYIVRYAADKEEITGHPAEVGHFRYVGPAHAAYMYENNLCLEEYLETLRKYGPNDRLVIRDGNGNNWSVYYVAAESEGQTDLLLPEGVVYEVSGDNAGGFIVSVKSVWDGPLYEAPEPVPVEGVKFTGSNYTVYVGNSISLTYSVLPKNADVKDVTFASSDPTVVSVSETGAVTALKPGAVIITVTTAEGGFTATTTVTAMNAPD